jgi:hypothetical protein
MWKNELEVRIYTKMFKNYCTGNLEGSEQESPIRGPGRAGRQRGVWCKSCEGECRWGTENCSGRDAFLAWHREGGRLLSPSHRQRYPMLYFKFCRNDFKSSFKSKQEAYLLPSNPHKSRRGKDGVGRYDWFHITRERSKAQRHIGCIYYSLLLHSRLVHSTLQTSAAC